MKKHANVAVIAIVSLGLLLAIRSSAHAGWENHTRGKNKELTVCRYEAISVSGTLNVTFTVRSSGDIAGNQGELSVSNSRSGDAEAAATAFAELAKSFPCAVGSLQDWWIGGSKGYAVECVCRGTRRTLISVTGDMMKFVMTSPETP